MTVAKTVKFDGVFPHREHRSRKGRSAYGSKIHRSRELRRKRQIEKLRIKDLENEKLCLDN
jgi:hypothetical protein